MYIFGSLVKSQLSEAEIKDTEETSISPILRVSGCCCGGNSGPVEARKWAGQERVVLDRT